MRPIPRSAIAWMLILLAPTCASARMYQWVSPSTATPQLSGEPPPWYRGEHGGPRVRVFENGNLVDDTAIELPPAQREELRSAAFREAEERRRADAVKRLERAARREERRRAELARLAEAREQRARQTAAASGKSGETGQDAAADRARTLDIPADSRIDEETVARLKAIIAEFDRAGGAAAAR